MGLGELGAVVAGWWRILVRLVLRGGRPPEDDAQRHDEVLRTYVDLLAAFREVPSISAADLLAVWDDPALQILDARPEDERAVSMLPASLPLEEVEISALRGRRVVVYCTLGWRSGREAARLRRQGVDVVNLAGGILAWTHVGGPLFRGVEPVREVHVVAEPWDLARKDYRSVW